MARWSPPAAPAMRGCSVSFAIGFPSSRDRGSSLPRIRDAADVAIRGGGRKAFRRPCKSRQQGRKTMPEQSQPRQLLHLVFGGELTDLDSVEFRDLGRLDIVGIYPNY